jgi:type II secretory pathway component PulF
MSGFAVGAGVPVVAFLCLAVFLGWRAGGGETTYRCVACLPGTWTPDERTVVAPSPAGAVAVLEAQGLLVYRVQRVWPIRRLLERGVRPSDFRRAVPHRQVADMADSVATLLENGITIQDALPMYARQQPDNKCREVLRRIDARIAGGDVSVEEAFSAHAAEFGREVATMIRIGATTATGTEGTFRQIAEMADRRAQFGSQVKKALIEPAMIGLTIFALLIYMSLYVLPQFKSFYQGYGSSLPWITSFTLDVTDWCIGHTWVLTGAAVLVGTLLWWLRHHPPSRLAWDRAVVHSPIYGRIVAAAAMGRVMGTVAAMIPVGVPLQVALPDAIGTAKNSYLEKVLHEVTAELGDASFQEAVHHHASELPDTLVAFVDTGAAAGALDEILSRYARITARDVDLATDSLQSVLKTTLILLIGVPAAWIMAAMWWPMIFYIRIIH